MDLKPSLTDGKPLKIAFTYDRRSDGIALGLPAEQCAEFATDGTIEGIAASLRKLGVVEMIGGMKSLTRSLISGTGGDWDLVFNMCEGYGTSGRESQVPALLEAWNIPFTFSDSATLALCLDKAKTKMVLEHYGIPTAPFACIPPRVSWPTSKHCPIATIEKSKHRQALQSFPLFVKPSSGSTGIGISQLNKVNNQSELIDVVEDISKRYPTQSILIEQFLGGREFTVGILGTGADARIIGVRELVFLKDNPQFPIDPTNPYDTHDSHLLDLDVYGHDLKDQWSPNPQRVDLNPNDRVSQAVAEVALQSWRILGCRDGGRIDIRHDLKGPTATPNFIEVNPIAGLTPDWSELPLLAKANNIDFDKLIAYMVDSALNRR
ncbi:D-alanine--D-alanine ligase [Phlegmacium glaucopus]|nr:D-alanine--D-alanine ligase [Phlegmacium glaucopus]